MSHRRFVALGDSLTEGIGDGDEIRGYRGWADRFAEHLARADPGVQYANLAVRGRLAAEVRDGQVPAALAMEPDLVTVVVGMNDVIRPGCRVQEVADCLDDTFARLTAAGVRVATMTYPDVVRLTPLARLVVPRLLYLNARVRAAARFGVTVVDLYPHAFAADPRMWSPDRLHASEEGCVRLAAAFAQALGLESEEPDWTRPLPPALPRSLATAITAETRWFAQCCVPWIYRRMRGRSSGDDCAPKRPVLTPVVGNDDLLSR